MSRTLSLLVAVGVVALAGTPATAMPGPSEAVSTSIATLRSGQLAEVSSVNTGLTSDGAATATRQSVRGLGGRSLRSLGGQIQIYKLLVGWPLVALAGAEVQAIEAPSPGAASTSTVSSSSEQGSAGRS